MEIGLFTQEELTKQCHEKEWLRQFRVLNDPYLPDGDSPEEYKQITESLGLKDPFTKDYVFTECKSAEQFLKEIREDNWPIDQGAVFNSLAFIHRVNILDECAAFKKLSDGSIVNIGSLLAEKLESGKDWGERKLPEVIEELDAVKTREELGIFMKTEYGAEQIQDEIQDEWDHEL
ncbi:hypothetical protein [Desulfitobacterium chlororespirans]|uniref:Uncharacterized protein n=1 Tax=Desulfitobacterium chlororespirans DSM 11544 TaxID=1121395 RepID=A0A1M7UYD8_9FIRM|nr:hypothetical protein [Desulfitobacterium chlororespirans]SHN87952.1 hypothetical protein SAMN02745215_05048 [Desulfitobacterium chlororespirans DSM 11544]